MTDTVSLIGNISGPIKAELHAALVEDVARHRESVPCLQQPGGIDWLDPPQHTAGSRRTVHRLLRSLSDPAEI